MRIPADVVEPSADAQHAVETLAYWFYGIAAVGSSIGQVWAMAAAPTWPHQVPVWIRVIVVAPFAVVIDLAGVVTSAFADARRRLGEAAYGWRALSLFAVTVAVAINIAGHRDALQYAVAFGFLGVLAYTIWLLHSATRRRDALRAAGKLAATAPVYGPWQWITDLPTTRLARQLALAQGLGLHESLAAAREHLRLRRRDQALAQRIEVLVRSMHHDRVRADIAVATIDLDTLANKTARLIDLDTWAATIAGDLNPTGPRTPAKKRTQDQQQRCNDSSPTEQPEPQDQSPVTAENAPQRTDEVARVLRRVPVLQADYDRWRQIWREMTGMNLTNREMADQHGANIRTLQHIRKAGILGLLDTTAPPTRNETPLTDSIAMPSSGENTSDEPA